MGQTVYELRYRSFDDVFPRLSGIKQAVLSATLMRSKQPVSSQVTTLEIHSTYSHVLFQVSGSSYDFIFNGKYSC